MLFMLSIVSVIRYQENFENGYEQLHYVDPGKVVKVFERDVSQKKENPVKRVTVGIYIAGGLGGIVMLVAAYFLMLGAQKAAKAFELNSPELKTRVIIATQGSSFKKALVAALVEELEEKAIFIKVIDLSALSEIVDAEWHTLVLVNTCQSRRLHPDAAAYLRRVTIPDKVILVTTSGSGRWQPENIGVDSISSASRKARLRPLVTEIVNRLNGLLERIEG
jgi:hypothetical protein